MQGGPKVSRFGTFSFPHLGLWLLVSFPVSFRAVLVDPVGCSRVFSPSGCLIVDDGSSVRDWMEDMRIAWASLDYNCFSDCFVLTV